MTDLYPDPPNLSIYIVSAIPKHAAMHAIALVLEQRESSFSGDVLVNTNASDFEWVSDLERRTVHVDSDAANLLASGESERIIRLGFDNRSVGYVSLGWASTGAIERLQPIEVSCYAGALGLPADVRSETDQTHARFLRTWSKEVLMASAVATGALYGACGIESLFPGPGRFRAGNAEPKLAPTTWFLSHALAAGSPQRSLLWNELTTALPNESWNDGMLIDVATSATGIEQMDNLVKVFQLLSNFSMSDSYDSIVNL
jgi:hypothetical protein